MSRPLVGIVGASGAVGTATAQRLAQGETVDIRLGARQPDKIQSLMERARITGGAMAVDIGDPAALDRFCAGCAVVVNCAGPSHSVQDRVARAAHAAGADYVDAGGDEPLHERLSAAELSRTGRRAIVSAGLVPGLSGLLPRWMAAHGFDRATRLTAYVRLRDRFTHAAAVDYLLSDVRGYGEPLAAWQHGTRVSRALDPLPNTSLPYFPAPIHAYPYLSREADRLAVALGLSELRWYHVFDDRRFVALVGRLQHDLVRGGSVDAAADALVEAVDLELFGRDPSVTIVVALAGVAAGQPSERTAILRARDTYGPCGVVAALAVDAVLARRLAPGVHFADAVLDPAVTIQRLQDDPAVASVELGDDGHGAPTDEEGEV